MLKRIFSDFIWNHTPDLIQTMYTRYLIKTEGQGESLLLREYYKNRKNVEIGLFTYGGCFSPNFNTGGKVTIGRYCSIAGDVHYFGANHPMSALSSSAYFYNKSFGLDVSDVERSCLSIGNDVWIGYGVIILAGCRKIGNGAVIGAGSIVTRDVPDYAVVAGNPARIIRYRFDQATVKRLNCSEWWKMKPEEVLQYYKDFVS